MEIPLNDQSDIPQRYKNLLRKIEVFTLRLELSIKTNTNRVEHFLQNSDSVN